MPMVAEIFETFSGTLSSAIEDILNLGSLPVPDFLFAAIPIILCIFPFLIKNNHFKNIKKDFGRKLSIALLPLFWVAAALLGALYQNHVIGPGWRRGVINAL